MFVIFPVQSLLIQRHFWTPQMEKRENSLVLIWYLPDSYHCQGSYHLCIHRWFTISLHLSMRGLDLKTYTSWKISIPDGPHLIFLGRNTQIPCQQLPICKNASNLCINLHFSKAEPEVIGEEASAQLMHHPQAAFRKSFLNADSPIAVIYPFLGFPLSSPFCLLAIFHFKDPQTMGLPQKCFASRPFLLPSHILSHMGIPPKSLELLVSKKNPRKINGHPWLQPTTFVEAKDKDPILLGAWRVARRSSRGKKSLGTTTNHEFRHIDGFMDGYPLVN